MKYITGFFMSWGNFCSLPCPCKRWDENCKSLMLGFLPSIGLLIGAIWGAVYFGLVYFSFPFLVVSFIITFMPFALSGFTHVDGFMDCCDAIRSRRPIEERQRILKDSNTGAFAVICMIFLVLGFYSFLSTSISMGIDFVNLVLIAILSRSVSGLHVLGCKPMGQSQYAALQPPESAGPTKKQGIILILVQLIIYLALGFVFSSFQLATAVIAGATAIGTSIAIFYGRKQLGGMSGDIAGYGIVWGEFAGIIAMIFC